MAAPLMTFCVPFSVGSVGSIDLSSSQRPISLVRQSKLAKTRWRMAAPALPWGLERRFKQASCSIRDRVLQNYHSGLGSPILSKHTRPENKRLYLHRRLIFVQATRSTRDRVLRKMCFSSFGSVSVGSVDLSFLYPPKGQFPLVRLNREPAEPHTFRCVSCMNVFPPPLTYSSWNNAPSTHLQQDSSDKTRWRMAAPAACDPPRNVLSRHPRSIRGRVVVDQEAFFCFTSRAVDLISLVRRVGVSEYSFYHLTNLHPKRTCRHR
ncbi:hypothetical protein C8R47DRAFT_129170 [Mycena vitilis]|nr:hypothetical protein C8R47DRAFT_129170 [Mycena vitilis]